MKVHCAIHPDRDAVGVCLGCGAGVCGACRVTVAGLTYCTACLEAGRYRPPQVVPSPAEPAPAIPLELMGSANRAVLLAGIVGFLLFGIAMQFAWIANLLGTYWWVLSAPVNTFETVAFFIMANAVTLCGCAFAALGRLFRSPLLGYAAATSFCSAWWLLAANLLQYTGLVWLGGYRFYPYYYGGVPGPLYPHYATLQIIGVTMLGVTLLLWSSALVVSRRLHNQRRLAIAAAVLFIIAAHVILLPLPIAIAPLLDPLMWSYAHFFYPFYLLFLIAAGLIEPACILSAVLIYRIQGRR